MKDLIENMNVFFSNYKKHSIYFFFYFNIEDILTY